MTSANWEPVTVETATKPRRSTKEQFPSLAGQGAISFDLETNDPDLRKRGPGAHRDGYIAGIAIGTEAGFRGYYPIAHENDEDNLPKEKVLSWLSQQLMLPVPKIGARLLYDLIFLDAAGVKSCGPYWDIQNAEPLIDENRRVYNLELAGAEVSQDRQARRGPDCLDSTSSWRQAAPQGAHLARSGEDRRSIRHR